MKSFYGYYIDLDERGKFSADVRDVGGKTVIEISGFDIFEDGFMRNKHDLSGLQSYLISTGALPAQSQILPMTEFEERVSKSVRLNAGTQVQTEDGLVFIATEDGRLVDNLDPALCDQSYASFNDLADEADVSIIGFVDESLLPAKFTDDLIGAVGSSAFREIAKRNADQPNPGICHSHDFCDANMVLLGAIQSLAGLPNDKYLDVANDRLTDTMNAAWGAAKATWSDRAAMFPSMKG